MADARPMTSLSITASSIDAGLLALPWATPLDAWKSDHIVSLPKRLMPEF